MEPSFETPAGITRRLISQRIVPVLRLGGGGLGERAFDCLLSAGFSAIEIAVTGPDAVLLIERLAGRLDPGVLIGAGSVVDLDVARRCMDAGARFLATPCIVPGIVRMAHPAGCATLCGGFTPGEVLAAHREGADIVRVFPASSGGPGHVHALHVAFPDVLLCPIGGVSLQNMGGYFSAGATVVGIGSAILDQGALAAGDAANVIAGARSFLTMLPFPPPTCGTTGDARPPDPASIA